MKRLLWLPARVAVHTLELAWWLAFRESLRRRPMGQHQDPINW